ncbi:MAG: TonB-dependent receptor [Bradyrhizobium sp.]|nr:TonB-dependent receptor [Bradyrhizobium sp.]
MAHPNLKSLYLLSSAVFAIGIAVPATAQTASAPAPQAAPADQGLADIIVTARKISENQQSVPIAVTVQSGEALQQQSAVKIPDIARLTPGITFATAPSTATSVTITIRGQVQTDVLATLDPSVGTYVDGVYWARAYGLNADLLDVKNAQVLRGPQGTLFGRNTTGGAVLLETNDPSATALSGSISATYGRFNERSATGVLNIPIIADRVAIRGAFSVNKRDGFFTDTTNGVKLGGRDSYSGRVKLLIKPSDSFSLILSAENYHSDSLTRPYQLTYINSGSANFEAGLEANPANAALLATPAGQGQLFGIGAAIFANYIPTVTGTDKAALNEDPRSYANTNTYSGTATLDTSFGAIKFIGGYRQIHAFANIDLDGSPINLVRTLGTQNLKQYSGELQLTGKALSDNLDFALGAFYFDESGRDESTSVALPTLSGIFGGGVVPQTFYVGDVTNRSKGVYGQATYHFSDQFSFTGGLRYSSEDKNLVSFNHTSNFATGALIQCLVVGATAGTCRAENDGSFSGVSYTAGLNYQITPNVLLYIKTSKGFRSGGQNLRSSGTTLVPFQPEIAREEEIGLKSEFLDRRVRLNIAAFYNQVSNIQRSSLVSFTDPTTHVTSTQTILGNAGKARFAGGEAELTVRAAPGLTLSGNVALADAKYLQYADAGGDRRDEVFAYAPKWTFSIAANYEHPTSFGRVTAHLDYAWQGVTYLAGPSTKLTGVAATDAVTNGALNAVTRPAGGELNGRLGVGLMDDRFELSVFGRNILDRRVNSTGLYFGTGLPLVSSQRNDPATYGVTLSFKFGAQ